MPFTKYKGKKREQVVGPKKALRQVRQPNRNTNY